MYKFNEVIDLGDGVTAYYQGPLGNDERKAVPHLHVVSLRGGDHCGPTRLWCDKCGAILPLKFNTCPSCAVSTRFTQKDNIDEAGESAIIPAGTEVTVLFEDENGVMVELLDKSASFYIDKEFLSDSPPLLGGGWDYGGGVDADFPKPDLPCLRQRRTE